MTAADYVTLALIVTTFLGLVVLIILDPAGLANPTEKED